MNTWWPYAPQTEELVELVKLVGSSSDVDQGLVMQRGKMWASETFLATKDEEPLVSYSWARAFGVVSSLYVYVVLRGSKKVTVCLTPE